MFSNILLSILATAPLVAARPRGCAGTAPQVTTGKALYFITNDAENAVVALPIGPDGLLSNGTKTATGGAGSVAVDAEGNPAVPDALISQSAITIAGNNIFAVNAGSNSLSMLAIDETDPTKLTLLGAPIEIPGEFPNTVSANMENQLVCVGTTGAVAGVACAPFTDGIGMGSMDGLRVMELGQTTPPAGPLNTVSQVFFSENGESLFATVKGDPNVNNTGFLSVFPVEQDCTDTNLGSNSTLRTRNGKGKGGGRRRMGQQGEEDTPESIITILSQTDVKSSPAGTAVLFGSLPIPGTNNRIFATDASFGAAILEVDGADSASLIAATPIEGQAATCWVTISSFTKTAFVTDVAVNRLVEMSTEDASIISILDLSANGNPGLIDLRASGTFIYALSPGNAEVGPHVSVVDVSGGAGTGKEVQNFDVGSFCSSNSMGMA